MNDLSPWEDDDEKIEFYSYVVSRIHPFILRAMWNEWTSPLPTIHPDHVPPEPITDDDASAIMEAIERGDIKQINKNS